SELFGAEKGAFTGADRARSGRFARADGGTVFLDEIGETPAEVQVLLLRVLETGRLRAVGGDADRTVDVRWIAATDADLDAAIQAGSFRAPLLHRLSGYEIRLPPLRARRDDFGLLLRHFLAQELETVGESHRLVQTDDERLRGRRPWLPAALVARLARYAWPGNVRQLRNVARQLVIANRGRAQLQMTPELARRLGLIDAPIELHADGDPAAVASAPAAAPPPTPPRPRQSYRPPEDVSEDELIETLRAHAFRLKPAAKALGISRTSLYALIARSDRVRKARDLDRPTIEQALADHDGDLGPAAAALEVSRDGLRRRMTELGI
ncbi:MAG: sigma 54-interacting transcriptional regulator, partial [Acidobacteriota bacterium]